MSPAAACPAPPGVRRTAWAGIGLAALLAGCATALPPTQPTLFSGRIAVQVPDMPERGFSAGFELSGSARQGELLLTGPLGTTAARARWAPGQAELSSAQGDSRHASLDDLAQQALGQPVPIAALFDWLRGRPWPEAAALARADGEPGFAQLGWQVSLAGLADGRIDAERDAPPRVRVRIRLTPAD